jgi:hypothetical protein
MSKQKQNASVFVALAAVVIALGLFLWRRKIVREEVTTEITYKGKQVEDVTYQEMLQKMLSNEFINSRGQLCINLFGRTTCFDGDPMDVLRTR